MYFFEQLSKIQFSYLGSKFLNGFQNLSRHLLHVTKWWRSKKNKGSNDVARAFRVGRTPNRRTKLRKQTRKYHMGENNSTMRKTEEMFPSCPPRLRIWRYALERITGHALYFDKVSAFDLNMAFVKTVWQWRGLYSVLPIYCPLRY